MRTAVCAERNDGTSTEIMFFSESTIVDLQGKSVAIKDIRFFYLSQEPDYKDIGFLEY
jgi:hypothetical protein